MDSSGDSRPHCLRKHRGRYAWLHGWALMAVTLLVLEQLLLVSASEMRPYAACPCTLHQDACQHILALAGVGSHICADHRNPALLHWLN